MNNNYYKTGYINGISHNFSTMLWDEDSNKIIYAIGSFLSRQLLDQALSSFQKGMSLRSDGEQLYTINKGYVAKINKAIDENKCDGWHGLFYNDDKRVIRVFEGESIVDKIYDWVTENTKSGLIPEWKDYIYNEINSLGLINKCAGYDLTGKAPKILVIDKELELEEKATELIRSIKTQGLKEGYIKLPVEENKELPYDMEFVDIIQELVLPHIETQNCHYNVGDPTSPIITSKIVSGKNTYSLYPKQVVMAQGLLNAIKNNIPYILLNGGMGVGKTYISIKLSAAIMLEHFKLNSGRLAIAVQGHLIEKWIRQVKECFNPIGIYPNFIILNSYKDVQKVEKTPKGFEVIIFPKDRVKRTWLIEHFEENKYKSLVKNDIYNSLKNIRMNLDATKPYILTEVSNVRSMKLIAIKLEKAYSKKVVAYMPYLENGEVVGYKISTTSEELKEMLCKYKTNNKAYDLLFKGSLESIKELIEINIDKIVSEKKSINIGSFENPTVCPHCGGKLYKKSSHIFEEDHWDEYNRSTLTTNSSNNAKCNAYIKADGTPLTNKEIDYIRRGISKYDVVENTMEYVYVDENDEPIFGNELLKVKQDPRDVTILIKVCGEKIVGVKNQKGYRCTDTTKLLLKKLGKNSIDVFIQDEVHLYASGSSLQGNTFGNMCKLGKVNIPMTGSLTGGKASDIFKLLFRLSPSSMLKNGYKFKDESLFVDHFGRKEQETIVYDESMTASGLKVSRKPWREIPGISPLLYNMLLANYMISRTQDNLNIKLPKLTYYKHEIEMDEDLKRNYDDLKSQFLAYMKANKHKSLGGSYMNNLIAFPDNPIQPPILSDGEIVATPRCIDDLNDRILSKENKLLETLDREIKEGRRVLLYACFTGEKGVSKRLKEIISKRFKVAELVGQKVKTQDREDWIEKQYQDGVQVLLTNPECVSTGLDIVQFPTIYFYEIPLNTKTLRQSEKRAHRIGQRMDCRIYYSYYKDSIQQDIILLQSQKKRASLALEGVFSNDLLSIMSSGGETVESMLNKVLEGKIVLKESELDDFGFEEEEVNFTFENQEDGNIEVTKTFVGKSSVVITPQEIDDFNVFVADDEFRKRFKKKKSAPVDGQLGFLF